MRSLAFLFGETALGSRFDKPDKGLDVFGCGKGSTHLFESLSGVEFGAKEQPVRLLDRLDAVGRKAVAFEADGIHTVAFGIARGDDLGEGRNVLGDDGVRGDIGIFADAAELMHGAEGADRGVVLDGDVAGERGAIDENRVAPDLGVVADVGVRHDEIVAAEARGASAFHGTAIDRGEFVEFVFVTGFERDALAFVGEILRVAADYAERVEVVAASKASGAFDHGVRFDDAAFAEFDFVADDGEGVDCDAVAEASGGRDGCARVDFAHSACSLLLDIREAHSVGFPGLKPILLTTFFAGLKSSSPC